MEPTLRERVRGCLLGGALGDAWGTFYEGVTGPIEFVTPPCPIISDDTELTLATCESVLERGEVQPADMAAHFVRWFSAGRIHGIGASTLKAFRDLCAGVHWAVAGSQGEFAAGNGAAMRIAPLAFLLDPNVRSERDLIRDVCRITHRNDEAYIGALAVILAIRAAASGQWSPGRSFLLLVVDQLPDSSVRHRIEQLLPLGIPATHVATAFGASGYVVDTVPMALYCAQSIASQSVESILCSAISCGGDTDTIASIAGQVAGTVVGANAIDKDRIKQIENSEDIISTVDRFADFVCRSNR